MEKHPLLKNSKIVSRAELFKQRNNTALQRLKAAQDFNHKKTKTELCTIQEEIDLGYTELINRLKKIRQRLLL